MVKRYLGRCDGDRGMDSRAVRAASSRLEKFLGHRIADKRVLRLIQKWLSARVIENGEWEKTEQGTVQGGK
jgi:hypothetical protein